MPPFPGSLSERSFVGGELTPAAWSRVDSANYQHGLKIGRNGFIQRQGGFTNRPGTAMIAPTKTTGLPVRLISFIFSNNVSYALEFGDEYMRVYRAGQQIESSPGVPFEIVSPYLTADLPNIQYRQIQNVLYLACAGYGVKKLVCTGDTGWAFLPLAYAPNLGRPAGNLALGYSNVYHVGNYSDNVEDIANPSPPPVAMLQASRPFMALGSLGGNTAYGNSNWNFPWAASTAGDLLVPGVNGFPNNASFRLEYYMVTAVNLDTGLESFPVLGSFTNFLCAADSLLANPPAGTGTPGFDLSSIHEQTVENSSVITGVNLTNPLSVDVTSVLKDGVQILSTGDLFTFSAAATGITELDGNTFTGLVTGNKVTFPGVNGIGLPAAVLTGASKLISNTSVITAVEHGATQDYSATYSGAANFDDGFYNAAAVWNRSPLPLTWAAPPVSGNYSYNVYKKSLAGLWGFMQNVAGLSFTDDGSVQPDTSKGPPTYQNVFVGINGDPSVIGIYQQRLVLADTPTQQDYVWASNVGKFDVFTQTSPAPVAADSVAFQVAGAQYNAVTQIIDNGFMLIFTETGEFSSYGSGSASSPGPITPTGIGLSQQAFYGASKLLSPLTIGKNVLYLQALQSKIRELLFNYYINGYSGNDLTTFSNHLFDGHRMVSWAYQQEPNSIVWVVREDGALLSLTYVPELELKAWTRHDTLGEFEQIVAIPEGTEHALYCVVNRFDGTRFVERFASRQIPMVAAREVLENGPNAGQLVTVMRPDYNEFVFMDCSSFYDGRNATTDKMNFNSGDPNAKGGGFIMTHGDANGNATAYWDVSMVGKAIILYDPANDAAIRCEIIAYVSPTDALVRPDMNLPANMQVQWILSDWALGVDSLSGLDYLDGQAVSILADGAVVSSPEKLADMQVVAGGTVTLDNFYAHIRVGLPYFTDMRALDIDTPQPGQTSQDKPQLVNKVGLFVDATRGLWAGSEPPSNDAVDPTEGLTAYKPSDYQSLGNVPQTKTGIIMEPIESKWLYGGGIFVRQLAPLPMTVTSLVPAGKFMMGG